MDWYPLINSIRIAAIATVAIFFLGIFFAEVTRKLPGAVKGIADVILTLPLVLPPTVVGWMILLLLGPKRIIGGWVLKTFGVKMVMTWWSAVFGTMAVAFPLMYRTARGGFESYDETLSDAARCLGTSEFRIFWKIKVPSCWRTLMAGVVLAFARALGEYGATSMVAGYTPGRTATISTTVYQLWRTGDDAGAFRWVLINIAISAVFLIVLNVLEKKQKSS